MTKKTPKMDSKSTKNLENFGSIFEIFVNFKFKRQRFDLSEPSPPQRSRSPRYPLDTIQPHQTLMVGHTRMQGCQSQGVQHLFRPHQRNLKVDSRYTGSDNEEDDFNDFSMNKGFFI